MLIDEAHRGSRSEDRVWKNYQINSLAMGTRSNIRLLFDRRWRHPVTLISLKNTEKAIVFDYAYHEFYDDGFGKDFRVRNAAFADDSDEANLYFVAALLMFFQQQVAFRRNSASAVASSIERPLLLAVGTTVQKTDSDVELVIDRLRSFLEHRSDVIDSIDRLMTRPTALLATDGQPLVYADLNCFGNRIRRLRPSMTQCGMRFSTLARVARCG